MSLEEALNASAASQLKLAAAMDRYATVMENIAAGNPSAIVAPTSGGDGPSAADTPAADKPKGKRRTQAEIAADAKAEADKLRAESGAGEVDAFGEEAGEADPFADDAQPAAKTITKDDVRTLILGVKAKNEEHAKKLLEKLGVKTLGTIAEKDYPKVVELAGKCGVTL